MLQTSVLAVPRSGLSELGN